MRVRGAPVLKLFQHHQRHRVRFLPSHVVASLQSLKDESEYHPRIDGVQHLVEGTMKTRHVLDHPAGFQVEQALYRRDGAAVCRLDHVGGRRALWCWAPM